MLRATVAPFPEHRAVREIGNGREEGAANFSRMSTTATTQHKWCLWRLLLHRCQTFHDGQEINYDKASYLGMHGA
jgi:hypothetical protein